MGIMSKKMETILMGVEGLGFDSGNREASNAGVQVLRFRQSCWESGLCVRMYD